MTDLIADLLDRLPLDKLPEQERERIRAFLHHYGTVFVELSVDEAWAYLQRLVRGDTQVVSELLALESDDAFMQRVRENTQRWDRVAAYEERVKGVREEFILALVPLVFRVLMLLVGL